MSKKSGKKFKYLENGKSFKAVPINFKGLSVAKNCLRPESASLNNSNRQTILVPSPKLKCILLTGDLIKNGPLK